MKSRINEEETVREKIDGNASQPENLCSMLVLKAETLKEQLESLAHLRTLSITPELRRDLLLTVASKLDMLNELVARSTAELTSFATTMKPTVLNVKQALLTST